MNWGTGIAIALISFICFMGTLVYFTFTKNADLVSENYYENELNYDEQKSEKANYTGLNTNIEIEKVPEGIVFQFPAEMKDFKDGSIEFYRPDQKKFDRIFDIELAADNKQAFDYANFVDGYYDISVRWEDTNNKGYIFESSISF